jgi:hypothetical protein
MQNTTQKTANISSGTISITEDIPLAAHGGFRHHALKGNYGKPTNATYAKPRNANISRINAACAAVSL